MASVRGIISMNKQKWLDLAEIIDAYRIFPRLFFGSYIALFLWTGIWATTLPVLSATQVGLVGTLTTVGAAWFNMYVKTGRKYEEKQ